MRTMRMAASAIAAIGIAGLLAGCNGTAGSPDAAVPDALRVGVPSLPEALDPGRVFIQQEIAILGLASGTLTTLDDDGKGTSMGLAETIDETDSAFTLTLKEGLTFSDGTDLTSEDVVASFDHYLADEANAFAYKFAPVTSVVAQDDLTVIFNIDRPYASLPWILATPQTAIIPSEVIAERGAALYDTPVPTAGEFAVESLGRDEVVLTANPNYAGSKPSTQKITFKRIADAAARLAQVQGGEIEFADSVSPKVLASLTEPVEARTTLGVNGIQTLSLNVRENSVLRDVGIRQAIARSIDRDQINQIAWAGMNAPALGLFASTSQYSKPFLPSTPELSEAEDYLSGTECAAGCTLELIVDSSDEASGDIALVVQQNLREVGITVEISKIETAGMIQRSTDGDFDILVAFSYENGDFPDSLLPFQLGPAVQGFYSGYSSPEMDELLGLVAATRGEERAAAVEQVNELFEKDLPLIPIASNLSSSAGRVPADIFQVTPSFAYIVG